jgi:predicted nucleic acid-binding Zn ribbon protein
MRRRAPRKLAAAVDQLVGRIEPATTLAAVDRCWEGAVGEALARVARPATERAGVLTVACEDAVWAAELELMGPALLDSLNAALPGAPLHGLRVVADGRDTARRAR